MEALGFASLIEHMYELPTTLSKKFQILMRLYGLDDSFKNSSYLDPELGYAIESNKAYNYKENMWIWTAGPENRLRIPRFSAEAIVEGSAMLRGFCSMSEAALARSPCCSLSTAHISASLSRTVLPSQEV
jgi:hypothetical protein